MKATDFSVEFLFRKWPTGQTEFRRKVQIAKGYMAVQRTYQCKRSTENPTVKPADQRQMRESV